MTKLFKIKIPFTNKNIKISKFSGGSMQWSNWNTHKSIQISICTKHWNWDDWSRTCIPK